MIRTAHKLSLVIGLFVGILVLGPLSAAAAISGQLTGRIIDAKTTEALVGATVMLEGTSIGGKTNLKGDYSIKDIPFGTYTLSVSNIGYNPQKIEGVIIKDSTHNLDIVLEATALNLQKETIITGKRIQSTESAVLENRKEALTVTDAIGAQAIARSGGGNTAQAITRVTGASTDGRYVFIRGLGDRYSNTQLNGTALPTPDPEKQAVPLDLVPSDLLENIVITKSFMADMPGNFTGGSVNLVTRDFPSRRMFSFTSGSSYNSLITGKDMLSSSHSSTDWLGHDDGMRAIPQFIQNNISRIPNGSFYYRDTSATDRSGLGKALFEDSVSKALRPDFNLSKRTAPYNQNYGLSYGDSLSLFGRPLGAIASLAYNRSQSSYSNGDQTLYAATDATSITPIEILKDDRGVDNVLWGGLASLNYKLADKQQIGGRFIYNRNGRTESRFLRGSMDDFAQGSQIESHDNDYTERYLQCIQVNGNHEFRLGLPVTMQWRYGNSRTKQKEILQEYVTSLYIDSSVTPYDTSGPTFVGSIWPAVYWRDIDEKNHELNLDLKFALSHHSSFKVGASYLDKERSFRQTELIYQAAGDTLLQALHGDMSQWVTYSGLQDTLKYGQNRLYTFANAVTVFPSLSSEYDGSQKIPAWYGMLETPLFFDNLRLITGIRYERTDMHSLSLEKQPQGGKIDASEWLPAASLIYTLTPAMNLRAAYSRTLARPTLREIASFRSLDFAASKYYYGNANLRYTKITNYDLRWEWFARPGEVLAASVFYKKFIDPIEIAFTKDNYDRYPVNSSEAKNYGLELEFKKRLDDISSHLSNFNIGGNLTLVHSAEKIPESELMAMRNLDPKVSDTRPMAYQSPYIINLNVGYTNHKSGTDVALLYNVFGRRFYLNAVGAAPDIYEMPRHQLDMTFSQNVFHGVTLKLGARNILDSHFETDYYYTGTGARTVYQKYDLGRFFSFGVSYKIS